MIIAVVYRMSILAFGFLKDVVFDPRPAPIVSKKKKSEIVMKCWRIFEKMPYGAARMFEVLCRFTRPLGDGTIMWVNLWDPQQDEPVSGPSDSESEDGM